MLVVAPASDISRLDWLTNADDDARTEAGERADELAEATPTDDVESRVGDSNPVKAIQDALHTPRRRKLTRRQRSRARISRDYLEKRPRNR
jgi:hypothetical protein